MQVLFWCFFHFFGGDTMPSKRPVIMTYTDKETVEKFKIVAQNENRTVSKQLEYMIKKAIEEYESRNGAIPTIQTNINNNQGSINVQNNISQ